MVEYRIKREEKKKQDQDYVVIKQKADEHLRVYKADLEQRRLEGLFRSKRKGPRPKESIVTDTTPRLSIILKGMQKYQLGSSCLSALPLNEWSRHTFHFVSSGDVDGSVEAILDVLDTYHSSNKCRLDIIHYGVGPVTENDVSTAQAFEGDSQHQPKSWQLLIVNFSDTDCPSIGIIYSFNVAVLNEAKELAKTNKMTIKNFNIIYRLVDDLKEEINARLPTKEQDTILGFRHIKNSYPWLLPRRVALSFRPCFHRWSQCHSRILDQRR